MFIWTFLITKTYEITACCYALKSWNTLYLLSRTDEGDGVLGFHGGCWSDNSRVITSSKIQVIANISKEPSVSFFKGLNWVQLDI